MQEWRVLNLVGLTRPGILQTPWWSTKVISFPVTVRGIHPGADGRNYGVVLFHRSWHRVVQASHSGEWRFAKSDADSDGFVNGTAYAYTGPTGGRNRVSTREAT